MTATSSFDADGDVDSGNEENEEDNGGTKLSSPVVLFRLCCCLHPRFWKLPVVTPEASRCICLEDHHVDNGDGEEACSTEPLDWDPHHL